MASGIKTVFFCGHQSQYGLSHLVPVVEKFDVAAVVFADHSRWDFFRDQLRGKTHYVPRTGGVISMLSRFLPGKVKLLLKELTLGMYRYRSDLHRHGIRTIDVNDVNSDQFLAEIGKLDPDLILSAAYPQLFSKKLLDIPGRGAVNFHPSLLPKYRGAHPHFWQIVNGETTGGLTAHFMTENIDDGNIIAQVSYPIDDCTYRELYEKMIGNTPGLVEAVRKFFDTQTAVAQPQKKEDATSFRNDREIHGRIFWAIHTSREIHNLIRTGSAYCFFRGKKVVFFFSEITESNRNLTNNVRVENGTIVDVGKDSLAVKSKDGCINIKAIRQGGRILSFVQWARAVNLNIGEKFD